MKGLTSIELAILLAIIIVIAVAVGWYMYTTFLASTSSSPKLQVVSATYYTNGTLEITVINPGPVNNVGISAIYLNGVQCGTPSTTTVPISSTPQSITATCSSISAAVGTQLSGQLVTTAGTTFPFTAVVASS
ncbi:MAG: class III signal peptide [Thermoproteus sp.]|jgi:uncharacterized protein (UPF0333 family)|nr:class III signal peptide [Thermoproteus sp.]MDT7881910.1 class III signal peptide [Thermoproteus sp.]